jgi:formate dehydrogenase subunit delta
VSDAQLNNLIKMLEQIIANNLHQGDDDQIAAVAADHLYKFWARSMKQQILAFAETNPDGLSDLARLTVTRLATSTQGPELA